MPEDVACVSQALKVFISMFCDKEKHMVQWSSYYKVCMYISFSHYMQKSEPVKV